MRSERIIKPSFFTHEKTRKLGSGKQILLLGMLAHCDSEGLVKLDDSLLISTFFPKDPEITNDSIVKFTNELADDNLIFIYEWDGKDYAWIIWFRTEFDWRNPISQKIDSNKPIYPAPKITERGLSNAIVIRDQYKCQKCRSFIEIYDFEKDSRPYVRVKGNAYPSQHITICSSCARQEPANGKDIIDHYANDNL